jgi:vanillate O-demethylase ferredoxin subunit
VRHPDLWSAARVERIEDVTPTIRMFTLAPEAALAWTPGSHLNVRIEVDGREETRSYSLLDLGKADARYRIAVKRIAEGLGGSLRMWRLAEGELLIISQPHNQFELGFFESGGDGPAAHQTPTLLVAGGIGITPILGMARRLAPGRRLLGLHYAVSSRAEAAFAGELGDWLGDRLSLHVAGEGTRLDLAAATAALPEVAEMMICGPIGMLEEARRLWGKQGRPMEKLRYESFAASGHWPNRAFTLRLPRHGVELAVPPHQTMLAALEQAGIEVLSDCRRGECGLCAVDILSCDSAIDHRDVFFSEDEKAADRKLCACVSRPLGGRIEIDTSYRGAASASDSAPPR